MRNPLQPDGSFIHFRNLLPTDIHLTFPIEAVVKAGEEIALRHNAENKIKFWVDYYGEHETTLNLDDKEHENLEIITLLGQDSSAMNLGVYWGTGFSHRECSIYAPYWIVNSTGKTISYVVSFIFRVINLYLCVCLGLNECLYEMRKENGCTWES